MTPDVLAVVPSKLRAIDTWLAPIDIKALRRILSLAGFYRHLIKNFGDTGGLLTELLQVDGTWHCSSGRANAFAALRAALCSAPMLAFLDPGQSL